MKVILPHTGDWMWDWIVILLRAVRIRAVLVTRIATDVRSGVGLVCDEAEIEARIRLDVDKHAGGP